MRAARVDDEVVADAGLTDGGASPANAAARSMLRKVWLPIPLLLLLLDVTFPLWFWHIPKLSGPGADYGYQFLVDARQLAVAPPPAEATSVLATGSSVAGAFDPRQVEGLLQQGAGQGVAVHRLLLPGIKPSDLRLFFATDGAALRPDVALLLLNPLDFLNPSFERDLKPQVRYVLPPWETLRERSAFIPTISGKLDLAMASVSNLYRYRKLIRSSFEDHARLALRWLRGGRATGGFGWYADGYTRQDFALPLAGNEAVDFEYYVHPDWLRQRGQVTLQFATARGPLRSQTETSPGWKTLRLEPPSGAGPLLYVSADSSWSPRAAGLEDEARLVGVQLRQPPAAAADGGRPPVHYPPRERDRPDELLRMRGAEGREFNDRWMELLEADTEFGRRFRSYRDSKLAARDRPIEPSGEYAELERLVTMLSERGTAVVLVNNPESPLMRTLYEDSPYYRSYLDFLKGLAGRTPHARFADLRAQLPAEDFNDWHHVTYIGQIKMGPVYADLVREVVAAAPPAGASTGGAGGQ
jgi:hypothetical protein